MSVNEARTATTGIPALDRALGGLYWGDNVVLDGESPTDVEPFYLAAASAEASLYDAMAFVTVSRDPKEIALTFPAFSVIDARPGTRIAEPRPLLDAVAQFAAGPGRHLVLFDTLEAMSHNWGPEIATRFFSRGCPMLLGLGAIAYWSLPAARHAPAMRREVEGITQCVLVVGDGTLRIAKAEGRAPGIAGTVFRYSLDENGLPVLAKAATAARLAEAVRALRASRRLSQSELGRLAGVSASAISQAERGRRGLSLDTLLELSGKLNVTLDQLLGGDVAPGYRLVRRDDPRHAENDKPVPLFDDPRAGLRAYLVRLSPGGTAVPGFAHKGIELVSVATGLVQVQLETGKPVLRQGEALIADRSGVEGWRNLTDREAIAFWILHDEPGA
jgi:transcriptional regulator with XRE-family HTH domain